MPDITIHISDELSDEQRQDIESAMRDIDGVVAPRFNLPHLLVILYVAQKITAAALLKAIQRKGLRAQLVGL